MTIIETDTIEGLKRQLMRLDNLEDGVIIENRIAGLDWPKEAETMIGLKRMENIQYCIEEILKNNILGDLIETGVWRGGACIFMRGILKVYDDTRKVFVADSFNGFPEKLKYSVDTVEMYIRNPVLQVSRSIVEENFRKYGLLDEQVEFVEGWFKDTLPSLNGPFSLIRLDGDLFESTWDALVNLYHKLSVGGYVIIDDYSHIAVCQLAVEMFRVKYKITENIINIDNVGAYWKKER
jgi:demethyldecarbamoylnovobiocin O-methyltransferase/8-demethyl-8-(2,3-dimethoxy-alpha-L-rhamnosyl)tetracenomycin-C 4'-O-methyltransferase